VTDQAQIMKLADFGSLVQFGVGLHAGTAVLQFVIEFASTPLAKRIDRVIELYERRAGIDPSHLDGLENARNLKAELELKAMQFFKEYKIAMVVNAIAACIILGILILLSFAPNAEVTFGQGVIISIASLASAPLSLLILWSRWTEHTGGLEREVRASEAAVMAS
jgi:hypothetical protein